MSVKDKPRMGATLYATVSKCCIGAALHHLEYHSDVHLIERLNTHPDHEVWLLRSDQWPSEFDKKDVVLLLIKGISGLEFNIQ